MPDVHALTIDWDAFGAYRSDIERLIAFMGPSEWPEYHRAAERVAKDAERNYQSYLGGEPTPAGKVKRPTGAVAKSTRLEQTGALFWVITNETPAAKALEEGTPERDMKQDLPTAKRVRRSKAGNLYLIIPFRHGVPTTRGIAPMPKEVYSLAKKMQFSRVNGAPSTRTSATGWTVPKWTYRWADNGGPQGRLPDQKKLINMGIDAGVARRVAGMVRMAKAGHTSYITFRVMSQASAPNSWVRPAVPGFWPMRYAVEKAMADNEGYLSEAFQADLWQGLGLASVDGG